MGTLRIGWGLWWLLILGALIDPSHHSARRPHHHLALHLWPWVPLVLVAVVLLYLTACAVMPFGRCWKCKGNGTYKKSKGRVTRPCRRCKGTGRRLRWGRHVSNYLHRTKDRSAKVDEKRERLGRRGGQQ
jgi:hypothetical protein